MISSIGRLLSLDRTTSGDEIQAELDKCIAKALEAEASINAVTAERKREFQLRLAAQEEQINQRFCLQQQQEEDEAEEDSE